jgi:hypothetical protein
MVHYTATTVPPNYCTRMAPKNVSIRRYASVAPLKQVICQVDNHETSAY